MWVAGESQDSPRGRMVAWTSTHRRPFCAQRCRICVRSTCHCPVCPFVSASCRHLAPTSRPLLSIHAITDAASDLVEHLHTPEALGCHVKVAARGAVGHRVRQHRAVLAAPPSLPRRKVEAEHLEPAARAREGLSATVFSLPEGTRAFGDALSTLGLVRQDMICNHVRCVHASARYWPGGAARAMLVPAHVRGRRNVMGAL